MKQVTRIAALGLALAASTVLAAQVGSEAPDFALPDAKGQTVKLSDHRGQYVVLEWVNPDCPFVQRHYDSGNMPRLQKTLGEQNVVWLTINSTHPSHANFRTAAQMKTWLERKNAAPAAMLLDRDAKAARLYQAKTTPHMFVIDPQGTLLYAGAIDDKRSADPAGMATAKNYVATALAEARAGKPVSTPQTTPYGCTVKYGR